jgi:hypothetical protein
MKALSACCERLKFGAIFYEQEKAGAVEMSREAIVMTRIFVYIAFALKSRAEGATMRNMKSKSTWFLGAGILALAGIGQMASAAPGDRGVADRRENVRDRREDRFDKREDKWDAREDKRDAREDVRDAQKVGGRRDRLEDRWDAREDKWDAREDKRDAREDVRDARENVRDRRENRRFSPQRRYNRYSGYGWFRR